MSQTPQFRVRAGGFSAQCPRCEAPDFTAADASALLACLSCGIEVHRAALLQQIAASARLTAEYMAEQARRLQHMAN